MGLAGLAVLEEVPFADVQLAGHEGLLVEVNAHQRRQPMRVEIRIGESAGEGEDLLDVGLVVQMRGTLLEDGEVHRELVPQPQIRKDAELVE